MLSPTGIILIVYHKVYIFDMYPAAGYRAIRKSSVFCFLRTEA